MEKEQSECKVSAGQAPAATARGPIHAPSDWGAGCLRSRSSGNTDLPEQSVSGWSPTSRFGLPGLRASSTSRRRRPMPNCFRSSGAWRNCWRRSLSSTWLSICILPAPDSSQWTTIHHSRPDIKLIVIGPGGNNELIMKAIVAGARAYLDQKDGPQVVRTAIEVVTEGSIWAPRRLLSQLIDRLLRTRTRTQLFLLLQLRCLRLQRLNLRSASCRSLN